MISSYNLKDNASHIQMHYQKLCNLCVCCIRVFKCLKNTASLLYICFDVINIIAAINSLIEFIAVMNYVKTITSDNVSLGMK